MSSPQVAVERWLEAWRDRRFADMAAYTQVHMRLREPNMAARLETMFGHRRLAGFEVRTVEDVAPAMSIATVRLEFEGGLAPAMMTANVLYEDDEGRPVDRAGTGGHWGVNEISALRQRVIGGGPSRRERRTAARKVARMAARPASEPRP